MEHNPNIFPECDADTLLVKLIIQNERFHNHRKGISKVATALKKCPLKQGPAIGLVDNDKFKTLPSYFKECEVKEDLSKKQEQLILKQHVATGHFVIHLHPAFERWFWHQYELCSEKISDTDEIHVSSFESLRNLTKHFGNTGSCPNELRLFMKKVITLNPPGIIRLREWFKKNALK